MPPTPMPRPLPTARFNHASLNCRDLETAVAFYESVLGFHRVPRPGFDFRGAWLYRDGLGMMLHLIEDRAFEPPTDTINSRINHLAFRVTDVDQTLTLLTEHGVEHTHKRLVDYGYRQVFFRDPSGNVLEVGEWPDVEQMPLSKGEMRKGKGE